MTNKIVIQEWKPIQKGCLLGFARVLLPSGLIMHDVSILTGDRGPWASPPSKPMIGRDGAPLTDNAGKARYSTIIEFASKEYRNRWSVGVIEAMRDAHPEVFA